MLQSGSSQFDELATLVVGHCDWHDSSTDCFMVLILCSSSAILEMDIWRRNIRRRIEMRPVFQSPPPPPPYPFNDVIINSVIPEYGMKWDISIFPLANQC